MTANDLCPPAPPAGAAAAPPPSDKRTLRLMFSALGWGGGIAGLRMVCSFVSIKVTAVILGPAGLALVAQFSNFINVFQCMLGQALMTGVVRLDAEYGEDAARRRRVRSTAARMLVVLALVVGGLVAALSGPTSQWLLGDREHEAVVALAGIAIASAMIADLLSGTLSAVHEIGLVGTATMVSTVLGLAIFAPCAWAWGVHGALWASMALLVASALVFAIVVATRSRGVRLSDFIGRFDRVEFRRLLGFYPMLLVNGALAPLTLILVRDTLAARIGLDAAGQWQAAWRLSEAYQAVILSSTSLYFMPSLGQRIGRPAALRRQVLRTLGLVTGATASLALVIGLLREPIVGIVFSGRFQLVAGLLPLQLVGDVLKMAGWIFAMALVATMRTRRYIALTTLSTVSFVGMTHLLVPFAGVDGAVQAYVATGVLQVVLGALFLVDVLSPRRAADDAAPAEGSTP